MAVTLYGYTGGTQRVVGRGGDQRTVLCWGDDISDDEMAPFLDHYDDVWIEPVDDPDAERAAFPPYAGSA